MDWAVSPWNDILSVALIVLVPLVVVGGTIAAIVVGRRRRTWRWAVGSLAVLAVDLFVVYVVFASTLQLG